ncbi:hypothetical protein T01_970, partial [Trichinella spiralis]
LLGIEVLGPLLAPVTLLTPSGPEFNSQQPHGGSQPSVMRSDSGVS